MYLVTKGLFKKKMVRKVEKMSILKLNLNMNSSIYDIEIFLGNAFFLIFKALH